MKKARVRYDEILRTINNVIANKFSVQSGEHAVFFLKNYINSANNVVERCHLGKPKKNINKTVRDRIRAIMALAWAVSNNEEHARQMKEWLSRGDLTQSQIEEQIAHLWSNRNLGGLASPNNLAQKQVLLNHTPLDFFCTYSVSPQMEIPGERGRISLNRSDEDIWDMVLRRPRETGGTAPPCLRLDRVQGPERRTARVTPYYILPWQDKAVTYCQIPTRTAMARTPDIFFTAILDSSVFIKGPASTPTIYSAGAASGFSNIRDDDDPNHAHSDTIAARINRDSVGYWRQVYMDLTSTPRTPHTRKAMANIAEVNINEYYNNDRIQFFSKRMQLVLKRRGKSFRELLRYISGSACVMGIRERSGDWVFYVQENVFLNYQSTGRRTIKMSIPIRVRQIFPVANKKLIWDGVSQLLPDNVNDNDILFR